MKNVIDQPGQRFFTATEKKMKRCVETKHLIFNSGYNASTLYSKFKK